MNRNAFYQIVEEMNRDEKLAEIAREERAADRVAYPSSSGIGWVEVSQIAHPGDTYSSNNYQTDRN